MTSQVLGLGLASHGLGLGLVGHGLGLGLGLVGHVLDSMTGRHSSSGSGSSKVLPTINKRTLTF